MKSSMLIMEVKYLDEMLVFQIVVRLLFAKPANLAVFRALSCRFRFIELSMLTLLSVCMHRQREVEQKVPLLPIARNKT